MALQIVLNAVLAVMWMFLNSDWTVAGFLGGYIVGLLMIIMLRRFFERPIYLIKFWAIVKLLLIFFQELILSNITVIRQVLRPRLNIEPGIFALHTELETDFEVMLLANLITLTPGTVTLEISADQKKIYIHAMDIDQAKKEVRAAKRRFERAIKGVTR